MLRSIMALALTGVLALGATARADEAVQTPETALRQTLSALYYDKLTGFMIKSIEASNQNEEFAQEANDFMRSITTEDYTHTTAFGDVQNRDKMFASKARKTAKTGKAVPQIKLYGVLIVLDETALAADGQQARVDSLCAVSTGITNSQGKTENLVLLNKTRDLWIKTAGGWKLQSSKDLWESGSLDGSKALENRAKN